MSKEDNLREALKTAAQAFKEYDANPSTWLTWIRYFLNELQKQAVDVNPMYQKVYDDMLAMLLDSIRNRLRTGGW
jgi:hypothetical protein